MAEVRHPGEIKLAGGGECLLYLLVFAAPAVTTTRGHGVEMKRI